MEIKERPLLPLEDYSWDGNTHESIILHTTLGSNYQGAYDTLKIRHLSYHFIIDEFGEISQLVDIGRSAWHAGVKSNPTARALAFYGTDNPNRRSIGIAFVRNRHPELTQMQRDAAVWLIKEIGKKTGVRYNKNNIFAHVEVTDYKPEEVYTSYMPAVVDGLVGFKDDKDADPDELREQLITLLLQLIAMLQEELAKRQES